MKNVALKRFSFLEKRLSKDPVLKTQYTAYMQEYIDLRHMTQVNPNNYDSPFYIPQHCVIIGIQFHNQITSGL